MTLPSLNNQFSIYGYNFQEGEYRIIKAIESKSLIGMNDMDLITLIGGLINSSIVALNHKPMDDKMYEKTVTMLFNNIKRNYINLRIEEIQLAVELGSMGEFGEDVVYVSAKNITGWLKAYTERKKKVFLALTTQKEKHNVTAALNESERKQLEYWQDFPKNLSKEFTIYKATGELSNIAWLYVKNLEEIGYVDFLDIDLETKKKMYAQEKENVIRRKREELKKTHKVITDKLLEVGDLDSEIKKECKLKALERWFGKIEFIDIEKIESLIKNR